MKMCSGLRVFALAALAAVTLSACGSIGGGPGGLNGLGSDPMTRVTDVCSDGPCSTDQKIVVAIAASIVNEQLITEMSDPVESGATGCVLYGAGYAAGEAPVGPVGVLVGGLTGCAGGGANGLYTYSYALDAATGTHTESVLRDWENGKKIPAAVLALYPNVSELCQGMHVSPSYIRTNNKTPKKVLKQHWTGPQVGSPIETNGSTS